jgi:hypothetical protein
MAPPVHEQAPKPSARLPDNADPEGGASKKAIGSPRFLAVVQAKDR